MKKNYTLLVILSLVTYFSLGQVSVQMINKNGVSVIPCKVNGLDMDFIFDTGASDVSISLTEALYMHKHGQLLDFDIKSKEFYADATGKISEGTKIIIKEILVAGIKIENVDASVVNSLDAPLLLGQSAIRKFGRFTFDLNNQTIVFLDHNKPNILNIPSKPIKPTKPPVYSMSNICGPYLYKTNLSSKSNGEMFLFNSDASKQIISIPVNAEIFVLEKANGNDMFYYICINGTKGFISKNLLTKTQ